MKVKIKKIAPVAEEEIIGILIGEVEAGSAFWVLRDDTKGTFTSSRVAEVRTDLSGDIIAATKNSTYSIKKIGEVPGQANNYIKALEIQKKYNIEFRQVGDYLRMEKNKERGKPLCSKCGGTGNELSGMYKECDKCNGEGYV